MNIINILAGNNFFIFNKDIAKVYGTNVAILLGSLCNRYSYYQKRKELLIIDKKEYFYCIREHIYNDTGLNEHFQRQSTKVLQDLGILEIKRKGIPSKNFYHINIKKLQEILETTSPSSDEELDVNDMKLNNSNNINIINDINNTDFNFKKLKQENINNLNTDLAKKEKRISKKKQRELEQQQNDIAINNLIDKFTDNKNIQKLLGQYVEVRKQRGILTPAQFMIILDDLKTYCGNDLIHQEMCIRKAIAGGWSQIVFIDNFKGKVKTSYSSFDNTAGHFTGNEKITDEQFEQMSFEEQKAYANKMALADMTKKQREFFNQHCLARDENGNLLEF